MNDFPHTDPELRKELAREAKEKLEDRIFLEAISALHKQWYGLLMTCGHDKDRICEVTYRLRALEDIPRQLASFVNDQKMAGNRSTIGRIR